MKTKKKKNQMEKEEKKRQLKNVTSDEIGNPLSTHVDLFSNAKLQY